jgi:hypothetical protein
VKPTTLGAVAILFAAASSRADVPADRQATLMFRILAYDRTLPAHAKDSIRIALVFKEGDPASEAAARELGAALQVCAEKARIFGLPVKAVRLPYNSGRFETDLQAAAASVVYLCPGLEEVVAAIARVTQSGSALTFTGTEAYVRSSASIAMVVRGEKAALVVNLNNARAEGADLDSTMLKLAELIR